MEDGRDTWKDWIDDKSCGTGDYALPEKEVGRTTAN